jgi:hypothetical protein
MIKSFQTGSEFTGLPFPTMTMDAVFRGHPLASVGGRKPGTQKAQANGWAAPANGHLVPVASSSSSAGKPGSSPPVTYTSRAAASQNGAAPGPSSSLPLPLFGTLSKNSVLINADAHRIDMPLPPKSASATEAFSRKTNTGEMVGEHARLLICKPGPERGGIIVVTTVRLGVKSRSIA